MTASEKIAKILRADKNYVEKIAQHLSGITKREGVMEAIMAENEEKMGDRMLRLDVERNAGAKEISDALISKIEADNHIITQALGTPSLKKMSDYEGIVEAIKKVKGIERGFFMKKEKAIEFLKKEPPKKILAFLKYDSVDAMLEKEDLFEVMSALRFIEGNEWLNDVFFKQYALLTPSDFEEREIVIRPLPEKWGSAAQEFVKKKWHNISHLKEMGVVFVIPLTLGISGELLRMMALVFHYLNEVPFYSDMFRRCTEFPETFAENVISLLRGDVLDRHMPEGEKTLWLVVQRYLTKEDENEWRLFVPHLNPEAIHWTKAGQDIMKLGEVLGDGGVDPVVKTRSADAERNRVSTNGVDLSFWAGLDWVGDFFKDELGEDTLVSFNLVDTVMSLVEEKESIKFMYHHQEALWNQIFASYFSFEEMEKFSKDYLLQGYFEI